MATAGDSKLPVSKAAKREVCNYVVLLLRTRRMLQLHAISIGVRIIQRQCTDVTFCRRQLADQAGPGPWSPAWWSFSLLTSITSSWLLPGLQTGHNVETEQ